MDDLSTVFAKALQHGCNGFTIWRASEPGVWQVNARFGDGWRIRMSTTESLDAAFREVLAVDETEMDFLE